MMHAVPVVPETVVGVHERLPAAFGGSAGSTVRTLASAAGDMNERGFADWRRTNSRASWRNSHYRTPTGASSEPRHSGCFVGLGGIVHDLIGRRPRLTTAS